MNAFCRNVACAACQSKSDLHADYMGHASLTLVGSQPLAALACRHVTCNNSVHAYFELLAFHTCQFSLMCDNVTDQADLQAMLRALAQQCLLTTILS